MSRLYVLGSGGGCPTPQRQTSAYLLETRRGLVFLDGGTGLCRLHDPLFQEMMARHRRAWVLLTGYGHERAGGLPWAPQLLGRLEVVVAAPGGDRAEEWLGSLLRDPFVAGGLSAWKGGFAGGVRIQGLVPGSNRVAGEAVEAVAGGRELELALRVRDVTLALGMPTCDPVVDLARHGSVLIQDARLDAPDAPALGAGLTGVQVGEGAGRAEVQDLLIGGVPPAYEPGHVDRLLFQTAAAFPRTVVAEDMMCFRMSGQDADADEEKADPPDDEDSVATIDEPEAAAPGLDAEGAASGGATSEGGVPHQPA